MGSESVGRVDDLKGLGERGEVRRLAPHVPAARLIESATRAGAEALGFAGELGTLEPGKRAQVLAVTLPAGVDDVAEYLLGGIEPQDVCWLDPGTLGRPHLTVDP